MMSARCVLLVKLREGDDAGGDVGRAERVGDLFSASFGAVGDEQRVGALLDEVLRREIAHLPCTDEQDGFVGERAEDLARELGGDRGDGDRRAADLRFCADALRNGEGALKQRVQHGAEGSCGADCADLAGDIPGLFDLAENLGLANDHRVERGGDAEEMADGLALAQRVQVRRNRGGGDVEVLVEEVQRDGWCCAVVRAIGAFANGEELDAIAGGENEGFANAGLTGERARGVGEARDGNGEAFADVERSGGVVHTDEEQRAEFCLIVHWT